MKEWLNIFFFGYKCEYCIFRHYTIHVNMFGDRVCPNCYKIIKDLK